MTKILKYPFVEDIVRIRNSGQSASIVLTGNLVDSFYSPQQDSYVPLTHLFESVWKENLNLVFVSYKPCSPVRFSREEDHNLFREAWAKEQLSKEERAYLEIKPSSPKQFEEIQKKLEDSRKDFDESLQRTKDSSVAALVFLRNLCYVSRNAKDKVLAPKFLVTLVESADMILPSGEISRLSESDRKCISICRNWISDPDFTNSNDIVIFMAEGRSEINEEVTRLPSLVTVNVPSPDNNQRLQCIDWFSSKNQKGFTWTSSVKDASELASLSAGLSITALTQMLKECWYYGKPIEQEVITAKIKDFLKSQLGDVIDFLVVSRKLSDIIGNQDYKDYLEKEFIPILKDRRTCPSGFIVPGPNGVGKSFIWEAVASELKVPIIILKNIRSKWFGDTDVLFERLRRCLEALGFCMIFVDEADTALGCLSADAHETERRLIGNFQNMMSDPRLRGKVIWVLMTARINLLSPDIRRARRAGDFILSMFDPEDKDRLEFLKFVLGPVLKEPPTDEFLNKMKNATKRYYAGLFDTLRGDLIAAQLLHGPLDEEKILKAVANRISTIDGKARRLQTLYALHYCTHVNLLPPQYRDDVDKHDKEWVQEIYELGGTLD